MANPTRKSADPQDTQAPPAAQPQPAPAAAPKAGDRKVRQIEAPRFAGLEYGREAWLATAFADTTPQDLLEPSYWSHVSMKMRPRARVEAWADDGTWMAEYVVLDCGRNWAKLHLLAVHYLTTADVAATAADAMSPYEVTYRGPHSKWSVVRKADRVVMHEGSETMMAATTWLQERMKAGV